MPFTPAIENCDTWDNSQDSETCLGCAGDRYVDANLCVDSTAVDGCSVYANDEDACVTCEAGKSLTANNECVTTIANCK
ncbi:MAG: hypothetical protein DHS20C09_17140 [marine bacterium B5-7]|nr:MAG: hypothetical protein DHS20C09_17140 [marine bacterium B5-7]